MSSHQEKKPPEREFLHAISTPISTAYTLAMRMAETSASPERLKSQIAVLTRSLEQMIELVRQRRSELQAPAASDKRAS